MGPRRVTCAASAHAAGVQGGVRPEHAATRTTPVLGGVLLPPTPNGELRSHSQSQIAPVGLLGGAVGVMGKVTTNVDPWPGALETEMVPPCASTTRLATHSPIPNPP